MLTGQLSAINEIHCKRYWKRCVSVIQVDDNVTGRGTATGLEPKTIQFLSEDSTIQLDWPKWLSVLLRTKWMWIRVPLQSFKFQISQLIRARTSLTNYRVQIHSKRVCKMIKTHIKGRDTENKRAFKGQLIEEFCSLKRLVTKMEIHLWQSKKHVILEKLVSRCLMLNHR